MCLDQVFEGTSGIDNKYTTVQFTGEVWIFFLVCTFCIRGFVLGFDLIDVIDFLYGNIQNAWCGQNWLGCQLSYYADCRPTEKKIRSFHSVLA